MSSKYRDSGSIIGTPLDSGDGKSVFKISAANKIAPTPPVFAKLRERAVVSRERSLVNTAALAATHGASHYPEDHGVRHGRVDLDDIMDEEDRANLRVKEVIRKKKGDVLKVKGPNDESAVMPFLAASADIPEIVPLRSGTSQGYLQNGQSFFLREGISVAAEGEVPYRADYKLSELFAYVINPGKGRVGLGYDLDFSSGLSSHRGFSSSNFAEAAKEELQGPEIDNQAMNGSDDDGISDLANAGYRNLDVIAKRMSRKLKGKRNEDAITTSRRKRGLHEFEKSSIERPLFQSFVPKVSLPQEKDMFGEETFDIPKEFASNPSHSFDTDRFRRNEEVLPPHLREEYQRLAQAQASFLEEGTRAVEASIAKANVHKAAHLQNLRNQVLQEMGSKFVPAQTKQDKSEAMPIDGKDSGSGHPNIGEKRRTSQPWKPEALLCKRFGVPEPDFVEPVSSKRLETDNSRKLLSGRDDDIFQIHSMKTADGGDVDLRNRPIQVDGDVLVDVNEGGGQYGDQHASIVPSREFVSAIFTDRVTTLVEANSSDEKKLSEETHPETSGPHRNRGVHRTRAADFF